MTTAAFKQGRIASKIGLQRNANPYNPASGNQKERDMAADWLEGFASHDTLQHPLRVKPWR